MKRRVKPTGKAPKAWAPGPAGGGSAGQPPAKRKAGPARALGPPPNRPEGRIQAAGIRQRRRQNAGPGRPRLDKE